MANLEQFANNASSTLNGTINNSTTTVVVASASSFPTEGNFRILIDSEIMIVTAVSTNTFTVERAQESTLAATHNNGVSVVHILTAGSLQQTITDGAPVVKNTISQTSHGFSVGNVLLFNGTAFALAQADSAADAEVVGIVSVVIDANDFVLTEEGYVTGLSGLTAGTTYFLSPTSAGALTSTEPSSGGQVSKPLLIADSTTSGYFHNWRGVVQVSNLLTSSTTTNLTGVLYGNGSTLTTSTISTGLSLSSGTLTNTQLGGFNHPPIVTPPTVASSFTTWVNQGSTTATDSAIGPFIVNTAGQGTGESFSGVFKTLPSTPYTITAAVMPLTNAQNYNGVGIALRASSSGFIKHLQFRNSAAGTGCNLRFLTNATTFSSEPYGAEWLAGSLMYCQITDNGTTRKYYFSADGYNFIQMLSEASSSNTPNQVGFGIWSVTTNAAIAGTLVSYSD